MVKVVEPPVMKPAIVQTCPRRHMYYKEQGTETLCPYCMLRRLHHLEGILEQAQGTAQLLLNDLGRRS